MTLLRRIAAGVLSRLRRLRPTGAPGRTQLVRFAVLALVLSGGAWWVQRDLDDREALERTRIEALASAEERVPALLSYGHTTLDRDLANALAQTTGTFRREYEVLVDEVIAPGATEGKVDTSASVSDAAVVSATDDEVVVLLMLLQSTTRGDASVPEVGGSRVRVTMSRTDGDWLVSALQPV
ncbi:hypothetical protein [Nocardioides daeguensis]|uniref:Mce-associated membrane protein n=1 Tax=Nocardioides daeguensis TaxID=908359 RepID=A0ABP6UW26_9ACTN|nr:hypothetical protein [Nocardioides daeguensis]MBV6725560.1 hypothetical protein [Nocardioides daeguensis]MCR1771420.1 hypothetical protein [Nocardioides daeguensis]